MKIDGKKHYQVAMFRSLNDIHSEIKLDIKAVSEGRAVLHAIRDMRGTGFKVLAVRLMSKSLTDTD